MEQIEILLYKNYFMLDGIVSVIMALSVFMLL